MTRIQDIAAQLPGYDAQALRVDTAQAFLARWVQPVQQQQQLPLFQSLGRVLAQDIVSPISVPPHDNSAMDGYAFDGAELAAHTPLLLTPVGTALAGSAWRGQLTRGECLRIMTGAILPPGLDTVVPQERVRHEGAQIVVPAGAIQAGDNRRLAGEDLMQGQAALAAGQLLTPAALGLVASLGLATVPVWRRLRVAYFSTGDEILSLGEAPREGAVYDSNRYTVFGLLQGLGCEVLDLGVVRDDPAALRQAFMQAQTQADAIITSGGVSVGEADFTKTLMQELGEVVFWKIAMRPGRPMAVGRLGKAMLFGLPGNPVAVMVTFLALVRPALLHMMGCSASAPVLLQAHSTEALRKKPGRTEYQRGWVQAGPDGRLQVRTTGNQGSGVLRSMVQANGLIVLHHDQGDAAPGALVDVMMFDGVI